MRSKMGNISAFLLVWVITAASLTLISALLIAYCGVAMSAMGIISSAISFLSAALAGTKIRGKIIKAAAFGAILSMLLILTGWLICGDMTKMSGIVSVIPFTITGAALGGCLASGRNKKVNSVNIKNRLKIK